MSLEGSIKDFALADIFQLITLQKKTGILTIHQGNTSATINFEKGQIVYAISTIRGELEKIGKLLISAGKLTEKGLNDALRIQEKTGEKIGQILVSSGYISRDDLREALKIQVKDVIFQILRWRDGWYRFDSQEIEYEREYQIPVPTDFVLMEGIRMLDEWPYIESIVPSDDIVFSQFYKGDEAGTLFSSLSSDEMLVFNLIDGRRDVKTIVDLAQFSEFDVYKILATLHVSELISMTSTSNRDEGAIPMDGGEKKRLWTAVQIAILTFIISFTLLLLPVREMIGMNDILLTSRLLRKIAAEKESSSLHRAIRYYYLINGAFPNSLEQLYKERYLKRRLILVPNLQIGDETLDVRL